MSSTGTSPLFRILCKFAPSRATSPAVGRTRKPRRHYRQTVIWPSHATLSGTAHDLSQLRIPPRPVCLWAGRSFSLSADSIYYSLYSRSTMMLFIRWNINEVWTKPDADSICIKDTFFPLMMTEYESCHGMGVSWSNQSTGLKWVHKTNSTRLEVTWFW